MKKATATLLLSAVAVAAFASFANAALRTPQVPFNTASLQGYLNSKDGGINVATDQDAAQTLRKTASGNSTFTLMLELAGDAANNSIGVYSNAVTPTLVTVFPGAATQGWFAVASFLSSGNVVVNLFDQDAVLQSSAVYPGVSGTDFGFFISGPNGTFYTQDYRNPGGNAQGLFFAGTGANAGTYWLAFEDIAYNSSDTDYNDAVLLLESVTPTAAEKGSWGALKARYR